MSAHIPPTRSSSGPGFGRLFVILCLLTLLANACGPPEQGRRDEGDQNTPSPEAETTERESAERKSARTNPEKTESGGSARRRAEASAALIPAAERGDVVAVKHLLDEGASVRARDATGRTALIAAAYGNRVEAARLLVGAGADVNAKDQTVQSAYLISTSEVGDDPRLLQLTLENGANVRSLDSYHGTGLIRAADRGHARIIGRLLETEIAVDHVNELGWTALLEAIILGDGGPPYQEVVRLLIEEGNADPNLADADGVTPLQHARQNGQEEIVAILSRSGARP